MDQNLAKFALTVSSWLGRVRPRIVQRKSFSWECLLSVRWRQVGEISQAREEAHQEIGAMHTRTAECWRRFSSTCAAFCVFGDLLEVRRDATLSPRPRRNCCAGEGVHHLGSSIFASVNLRTRVLRAHPETLDYWSRMIRAEGVFGAFLSIASTRASRPKFSPGYSPVIS